MPRKAKFPPPIYTDKTGNARARVWCQGKPTDFRLGKAGSPEAKAKYARILAEMTRHGGTLPDGFALDESRPRTAVPIGPTVAEVVERWTTQEVPRRYGDRGREASQFPLALAPVVRLFGDLPAAAFDATCLEAVQESMATASWMTSAERKAHEEQGRNIRWCINVVNRRIVRVRTVWRWADKRALVPRGSFDHLLTVEPLGPNCPFARSTPKVRPSSREHLDAVLPHCPKPIRAMLELQWLAGMRSEEVRTMRAGDIDRTGDIWLYRPNQHKRDWKPEEGERIIPLNASCQSVLSPWLKGRRPDAYLFPPSRRRKKGRPFYSDSGYPQAVARACRKAGVPNLTPYQGRHAAKRRITAAMGLDAARAVLGQKSLGTTNGYAAGIDLELATRAARTDATTTPEAS